MDKKDNKLFIIMIIGTLIVVAIVYFHFKSMIYGVFPQKQPISENKLSQNQEEILKIDTDKDGLYDFEERLSYGTSQYMADTDGDGFSDKEEIDQNSDPLNASSIPGQEISQSEKEVVEKSKDENKNIKVVKPKEITADEIRKLLIEQADLSKEVVDSFDDKTLKSLYNETKDEFEENPENINK